MTVKELRPLLFGPEDQLQVEVAWVDDTYDITNQKSPVLETFANYFVDCVTCPQPFKYTIFLKEEYVRKGAKA